MAAAEGWWWWCLRDKVEFQWCIVFRKQQLKWCYCATQQQKKKTLKKWIYLVFSSFLIPQVRQKETKVHFIFIFSKLLFCFNNKKKYIYLDFQYSTEGGTNISFLDRFFLSFFHFFLFVFYKWVELSPCYQIGTLTSEHQREEMHWWAFLARLRFSRFSFLLNLSVILSFYLVFSLWWY